MKKFLKNFFIFIGLYVLYFITGIILTETKTVDKWWIFPNTVIADSSHDNDNSDAGSDGPHIFYEADKIIVKSLVGKDSTPQIIIDTFNIEQKGSIIVNCTFSNNQGWNFSTNLQDSLVIQPAEYNTTPDKLLAISDIEGEFAAFRKLLIANGVINDNYAWTYGNGHLVLVGDFFDRGLHVTECLWLIYKLEQEAAMAGGKVHFILGNHEIMNMGGDTRYVRNKYCANAKMLDTKYNTWFTPATELGRWLQTKNVAERIGNLLFVHGGFSEEVNELKLDLTTLNSICRQGYFVKDSIRKHGFTGANEILYSGKTSPFWYRELAEEDADEEQLNKTLKMYHVSNIIIGHTVVNEITPFYNKKVIDIDVKHAKGHSQALLCTGNSFYKTDTLGRKSGL